MRNDTGRGLSKHLSAKMIDLVLATLNTLSVADPTPSPWHSVTLSSRIVCRGLSITARDALREVTAPSFAICKVENSVRSTTDNPTGNVDLPYAAAIAINILASETSPYLFALKL
ncbi:hypothetical protein CEXT_425201 [Caerostris extrusa]|uniref:Uncharacterized protein n=1 Tax=Caerostris extrusa TaxID=172846 RepID=A0AAV4QUC9_CAEEX|nr:hypothetical protein CEXT_425201 [Caerostris extrusa]